MVDLGAAIAILMKKWVDAHGLAVKEKVAKYILGANRTSVKIAGMTRISLLLVPTPELNVSNVAISSGKFYLSFLGCDLLRGHNEALGVAAITLPGPD